MHNQYVLIVSDGTGETGYRVLKAAMRQFDADILITRYANVRNKNQIDDVLRASRRNNTLVVQTFASQTLRDYMMHRAAQEEIECIDVLGTLVQKLAAFFDTPPIAQPGTLHQVDEEYFDRVDAIEYAIRHDNGESLADLQNADIILVGVSRTGKSPISIYLAQEGWRVANIPILVGRKLPQQLFESDQEKIVGLVIDPERLAEARKVRMEQLGLDRSGYSETTQIREELEFSRAIFAQNPDWPVIDVTGKSVEEASQEVLDQLIGRGRRL